jgi:hypothetical protein
MEDFFDVGDILYQKFLLDIYRHCDKLHLPISTDEKEKMAFEMVEFVGKVIKSLENREPLLKISGSRKTYSRISRIISDNVKKDEFAQSVISYYISKRKISRRDLDSYLAVAAIAVLSKCKKTDISVLEEKIARAKPFIFRVASLLSPAVALHEKLVKEVPVEEEVFSQSFDTSFAKYIG